MNTGFVLHLTEEVLESYALGQLALRDCPATEEHLLICPICQDRLDQTDEYLRVMNVATSVASDRPLRRPQHAPAPQVRAIATIR